MLNKFLHKLLPTKKNAQLKSEKISPAPENYLPPPPPQENNGLSLSNIVPKPSSSQGALLF